MTDPKPLRVLRRHEVEQRTGLSRSSIYARLQLNPRRPTDVDPTFPRPISLGARSVGWIESEVEAWIQANIDRSRAQRRA